MGSWNLHFLMNITSFIPHDIVGLNSYPKGAQFWYVQFIPILSWARSAVKQKHDNIPQHSPRTTKNQQNCLENLSDLSCSSLCSYPKSFRFTFPCESPQFCCVWFNKKTTRNPEMFKFLPQAGFKHCTKVAAKRPFHSCALPKGFLINSRYTYTPLKRLNNFLYCTFTYLSVCLSIYVYIYICIYIYIYLCIKYRYIYIFLCIKYRYIYIYRDMICIYIYTFIAYATIEIYKCTATKHIAYPFQYPSQTRFKTSPQISPKAPINRSPASWDVHGLTSSQLPIRKHPEL